MNLIFQLYLTNLRAMNTLELIESISLRVGEYFPLWNQHIHLWLIHPACSSFGISLYHVRLYWRSPIGTRIALQQQATICLVQCLFWDFPMCFRRNSWKSQWYQSNGIMFVRGFFLFSALLISLLFLLSTVNIYVSKQARSFWALTSWLETILPHQFQFRFIISCIMKICFRLLIVPIIPVI